MNKAHFFSKKLTLIRHVFFGIILLNQACYAEEKRTIKDAYGENISVPANPQRIVTLSEIDLDSLLALSVKPIGTVNGRGQTTLPGYLLDKTDSSLTIVGDLNRPNIEKVIELEPDLILTGPDRPEVLALLNEIAPTVVTFQYGEPWKKVFQRSADIINHQDAAKLFLQHYDETILQTKEYLANVQGQTLSIVRWNPKGPSYMYSDSFASLIVEEVGLKRPDYQQDPGHTHSRPLSLEALHLLDGDWLVVGTLSPDGEAVDAMRQAQSTPAFTRLNAIQGKRYDAVDGSLWTSVGGPLAALEVINDLKRILSKPDALPLNP